MFGSLKKTATLASLLLSTCLSASLADEANKDTFDDRFKSLQDICSEHGYDYEEYSVVTEDGYILGLYRIPGMLFDSKPRAPKPAVLLQHGLEADMMEWVYNDYWLAPAFILSHDGYDVWMGNNRGNKYARGHTTLDNHSSEYWTFSQEEMGLYDDPAIIDYVLNKTGQSQLTYVGHSQGTTQMFIGSSMQPDYWKEKVNLAVALAPIANLHHTKADFLHLISDFATEIGDAAAMLGIYNIIPPSGVESEALVLFCTMFKWICNIALDMFADDDPSVDNKSRLPVAESMVPSGAGYMDWLHYAQSIKSGRFAQYDYGQRANLKIYGQETPPDYPIENINIPIALVAGSGDELGDPEDVQWLYEKIQDTVVFFETYNLGHMSFAIAYDMTWFSIDVV